MKKAIVYVVGMVFLFGTSAVAVDKVATPGTTPNQIIGDSGKSIAEKAAKKKAEAEKKAAKKKAAAEKASKAAVPSVK